MVHLATNKREEVRKRVLEREGDFELDVTVVDRS